MQIGFDKPVHPRRGTMRREVRDLIAAVGVTLIAFFLAAAFDVFEVMHEFTRKHEDLELDEVLLGLILGGLAAGWYSYRRWKDVARETAKRWEAESGLAMARENLAAAQAVARMGSWDCYLQTGQVIWSTQIFSILGFDPATTEPSRERLLERIHPDDALEMRAAMDFLVSSGGQFQKDFRVIRPGDDIIYVHGKGQLVRDMNGKPERIMGTFQDISDRKRAEQEISNLKSRFENILSAAGEGILGLDDKGRIIFCNPAAAHLTGWDQNEIVNQSYGEVLRQEDSHGNPRKMGDCPVCEAPYTGDEDVFWRKDGTCFPVEYSNMPIVQDGKMIGGVLVFRDISERFKAERALADKTRELADSNEELQNFAHIMSHDLQEPLRMVTVYMQLLEKRLEGTLDGDTQEFFGYATEGAQRMSLMIKDLVAFSQVETRAEEMEPTSMDEVVEMALANLAVAIVESGSEVDVQGGMPVVTADKQQMVRLIQNLVANGIKYCDPERPGHLKIRSKRVAGEWVFSVSDNGIGIEQEYLDRIFKIFRRLHTREEYEGTGIGLAIVKRIVERHGGRIWVQSKPGLGSTFFFSIPIGGDTVRAPSVTVASDSLTVH